MNFSNLTKSTFLEQAKNNNVGFKMNKLLCMETLCKRNALRQHSCVEGEKSFRHQKVSVTLPFGGKTTASSSLLG
jgi:hypothetical protein